MKKQTIIIPAYQKEDGTFVSEHTRTITKGQEPQEGLFDNLKEDLNHIFNKLSIRIPGLKVKLLPLAFREVNCLRLPANEQAKQYIKANEYTNDLALSYLIAFSPSATGVDIMLHSNRLSPEDFETRTAFDTAYAKAMGRGLAYFEETAKALAKGVEDSKYIEFREALNCISGQDVEYICRLNEKGDLDNSWELLACLRMVAGMRLSVNSSTLRSVNNLVMIKKGAA